MRDFTAQFDDDFDELTEHFQWQWEDPAGTAPFSSVQSDSLYLLDVSFVPRSLVRNQCPLTFNQCSFKAP